MKLCRMGVLLFVVGLMAQGCPMIEGTNRTFTSADTGQGGLFGDFGAEADGEGEGAPAEDDRGDAGREVVEPDVIRRQENLLYVLNQYRGLTIVDLDSDALLAQVPTTGYPRDLYFSDGQAFVLVSYVQDVELDNELSIGEPTSRLYVLDVSEPASAAIRSSIDLPGDLLDSRMVGDVLYTVTVEYVYNYGYYEDTAFAGNIASTTVSSVDLSDPEQLAVTDTHEFGGTGTVIHVTPEFAFIATPDWREGTTEITCLDITDANGILREIGAVAVRGTLDDRFKMDAWEGALRVVSSTWGGSSRQVYLSTFDLTQASLPRLAELRLEGAEGETLFATRFDGPRAYVVTFLVVDPLFVVDVADPAAPRLLGALEVPGYSTYIEPQGDRLIALGVDNTNGQRGTVSIFDVSGDGAPSLVDRVGFGEQWSWSNAFHDVKALTILDDVIIVPFSGWGGYAGGYERLQFISYTPDALALRGAVDLSGSILRSFDYDVYYYGVTTEQVTRIDAADLDNPVVASSVTIAENLVDFLEVNGDLGVEIVSRYDEGQLVVRTVDGAHTPLGELVFDGGEFFGAYRTGETLAIAGILWDDDPRYTVAVVDVSTPAAPALRYTIPVNVQPYNYYYYYYDYDFGGPEPAVDRLDAKDIAIGYPYGGAGGDAGFLLGNTLALRCFSDRFDSTVGGGTAYEGLAVIDLETGEWVSTLGLGYEYLVSLDAVEGTLYASTKESVGTLPFRRPMASYYIRALNVAEGTEGTAANVPGAFVQYDPDSDVLTLRDHQWTASGGLESSLETVRWSGGTRVTPLDSLELTSYTGSTVAAEDRVYIEQYDSQYAITQVVVDGDGALSASDALALNGSYGTLIGAAGDQVFAGLGYRAIAQIQFDAGVGSVAEVIPVSGYPSTVRFGSDAAYFPLGYYGLVEVPF